MVVIYWNCLTGLAAAIMLVPVWAGIKGSPCKKERRKIMTEETKLILDGIAGVKTELKNEINELGKNFDRKFEDIDKRLEDIDKRFGDIDKRFEDIDKRFEDIDKRFLDIDKRFGDIDKRLEDIDKRFENTDKRFESIERNMDTMRFILENEIRDNIRLVAEGHLDLYRKMEEVLKTSNEKEIMFMRLKYLESEVRAIKDKFGIA